MCIRDSPIEDAYFHQSHLKGKQDYGHQAVAVMISCNGIVLNYACLLYTSRLMNILQRIFTDYYEEIKYTLHPRKTEMENIDKMLGLSLIHI